MFKNKKILAFILILATVFIALTSCKSDKSDNSDNSDNSDDGVQNLNMSDDEISSETQEETTAEEIRDSLPDDLDFGGETLNLLVRGAAGNGTSYEFLADEETGDIINDAVYRRNRAVEGRLNLKLNVIEGPNWQDYDKALTLIRGSVNAGDNAYDIIAGYSVRIPVLSIEGILANFHDMPHIELSRPWWNKRIVDDMTIAGNLNFVVGDANLSLLGSSFVIYVNEKLRQEYGLPNLYDVVFDGKWTIDYMHNLVKNIYKDLNGDGVMDENDQYGAVWSVYGETDAFIPSSNIRFTSRDGDGFPVLDIEYEKLAGLVNRVYGFYYENTGVAVAARHDVEVIERFKDGRTLLAPGYIGFSYWYYRDIDDFGIIPYPKYDENQDKYYTAVQGGMSLLCVPSNYSKTEMTGAFLEAAASESYKNLTPTYFDTAMKIKFARDEASSQMLDIVRNGINMGFVDIYNESIGNPTYVMRDLMSQKDNNFASWYEKNENKISLAIEKLIAKMQSEEK